MSTLDTKKTVIERFLRIADYFPDRIAVKWLDDNKWQSITYKALKSSAAKVAAALTTSGLNYGEAVIIPSPIATGNNLNKKLISNFYFTIFAVYGPCGAHSEVCPIIHQIYHFKQREKSYRLENISF